MNTAASEGYLLVKYLLFRYKSLLKSLWAVFLLPVLLHGLRLLGHMIRHPRMGPTVKNCVEQIPAISLASSIQPITRTVLRVRLTIKPEFKWNDKVHGCTSEPWWIWVEDPDNNHIYHSEYFLLHKKQVCEKKSFAALKATCTLYISLQKQVTSIETGFTRKSNGLLLSACKESRVR